MVYETDTDRTLSSNHISCDAANRWFQAYSVTTHIFWLYGAAVWREKKTNINCCFYCSVASTCILNISYIMLDFGYVWDFATCMGTKVGFCCSSVWRNSSWWKTLVSCPSIHIIQKDNLVSSHQLLEGFVFMSAFVKYEVPIALSIKSMIFWDVTLFSFLERCRCIVRAFCLNFYGQFPT